MATTKKKRDGARIGQLNVRVPESLLVKLDVYLAHHRDVTKKMVVAQALDEYLRKPGA